MSIKKGGCTKFGKNHDKSILQILTVACLARSSGVLLPCCKLKKLDLGKGYKLKLLLQIYHGPVTSFAANGKVHVIVTS